MGPGNVVGPHCVIGYPGGIRDTEALSGKVIIGADNRFGIGVIVTCGTEGYTILGDENLIMNRANIGHNAVIGSGCEIGAGCLIAGWATIGDDVRIKIGALIRNRKTVGDGALVGMGSNVVADVAPETKVKGNPARVY